MTNARNNSDQVKDVLQPNESLNSHSNTEAPEMSLNKTSSKDAREHRTEQEDTTGRAHPYRSGSWDVCSTGDQRQRSSGASGSNTGDQNPKQRGGSCSSTGDQEFESSMEVGGEMSPDEYHREGTQGEHEKWPSKSEEEKVLVGSPGHSQTSYLGEGIRHLKKSNHLIWLKPLRPSPEHTVLVEVSSVSPEKMPEPYRGRLSDVWDKDHVKMPCSKHNKYERNSYFGGPKHRWDVITTALRKRPSSVMDIEKAIKSYNKKYEMEWKFNGLHSFFDSLKPGEKDYYLQSVIPKMAELALDLPKICPKPIPLLKRRQQHAITMSQKQAACLLANAFFCTFPHRNATQGKSEYSSYPSINFNRLFEEGRLNKREKLRAIFCYFGQVVEKMRTGLVTFERRNCYVEANKWSRSQTKFTKLHVTREGTIEDDGKGMLQVDFASSMVGGGVLSSGLVQEEIRFLINTELIVSRLFTEKLDANESLLVTGTEQYSCYSGYRDNFEWQGAMIDKTGRDSWQRCRIQIVAIDALQFQDPSEQFRRTNMERELNKAYCGFQASSMMPEDKSPIATGNWGCGAFKGDPRMKGLLQLMAAAEVQRDVAYFTFGGQGIMKDLHDMHLFLQDDFTVGQLFICLKRYCEEVGKSTPEFYEFIKFNISKSRL